MSDVPSPGEADASPAPDVSGPDADARPDVRSGTPPDADTDRSGGPAGPEIGATLEIIGRVVAPASLLTAMFYFFGYMREQAFYQYFGVDLGSTGLSTTDYLMSSANVAFVPVSVLALITAGALVAQPVLAAGVTRCTGRACVVLASLLAAAAVALLAIAVTGLVLPSKEIWGQPLVAPIALGGAALLAGYGFTFGERHAAVPAGMRRKLVEGRTTRTVALAVLIMISLFWMTANIGAAHGRNQAAMIQRTLAIRPGATVYSRQKMYLLGSGVVTAPLNAANARYAFRYGGLRVLLHHAGQWVLLPAGWLPGRDAVVLLPDNDPDIRVEVTL